MSELIRRKFKENKIVFTNISYLSLLQVFNLIIPLISYPYLIRVVGADKYGQVVFAQAVVSYFSMAINFGFNISATKDIAINKNNTIRISKIVSSVYLIKLILWIISFIIVISINYILKSKFEDAMLLIYSFGATFYELLFPQYYFQGSERMKFISILNIVSRVLVLTLFFIVIKHESDYILIPIINAIGFTISGISSIIILRRVENINFHLPEKEYILKLLRESVPLFLSRFVSFFKDKTNVIFLGAFVSMRDVAFYDLIAKLLNVTLSVFYSVSQALFPKFTRHFKLNEFYAINIAVFFMGVCIYIVLGIFLPDIVDILKGGLVYINSLFWIFGLMLLFAPLSSMYGVVINSKGLTSKFFKNVLISSIFYFLLLIVIYYGDLIKVEYVALSLVLSVIFELANRVYICKKYIWKRLV